MSEEAARPSSANGSQQDEEEYEDDLIEIDEEPCDNVAFIFLKPTAQTDSVKALLDKLLRDRSITVLSSGETTCQHAVEKGIVEKHHSVKARFANKTPSARVRHPADIEESFAKHLGGKYADLTKAGTLINAVEAMEKFKCTAEELNDLWLLPDNGPLINITFELDVRKITSKEGVYVMNGYYPALQASLSDPKEKIIWYSVSWPEVALTWKAFRTDVIGHRDPTKAKPGSFRAILNEEWSSLGLAAAPTTIHNGIHCSSSPLEALVGRSLWADVPFGKDPLGMIIRERYSDNGVELCRQWSENNRISINGGAFLPTYEEVMDNQTSDFLDAIGQNVANDEAFLLFRAQRKAEVDKKKGAGAEGGDAFGEDGEEKADGPEAEEKAAADDSNTAKTEDASNADKSATKEGDTTNDDNTKTDASAAKADDTNKDVKADGSTAKDGNAKVDESNAAGAEEPATKADENAKDSDTKGDESDAGKMDESATKDGDTTANTNNSNATDESNNNVATGLAVGAGAAAGAAVVGGVAVAAASGAKEGDAKDDASASKAPDDNTTEAKDGDAKADDSSTKAAELETVKSEGVSEDEGDAPEGQSEASPEVKRQGRGGIGFAESSANAGSPSKTLHSRKSFIRVSSIAADDGDRWIDNEFKERHDAMCDSRWARIDSLYPGPQPGDPLLPTGMCIEHVAHGTVEDSFFYVSLSALLSHPGLVQNAFLTKEVRKDGRYTFQFYRWERWEKVEIDDTIMLNEEGQTIFCYSPTNHWWPLLLEKAYAKFYNSYDNILNGSVVEAMHDFTSKPVINMGLNEDLRMRINFQSVGNWRELGIDLADNKYAATVVAMLKDEDMEESNTGIRASDSYGVRRIVELPKTAAAKDGADEDVDEDVDYDQILVELYCPYRKSEYTGPWASSDTARWTEDAIRVVNPVFKRDAPPASDNNQTSIEHRQLIANTIYVPLSLILANFKSLQLCYIGAVKPKPFYYTDAWTEETAGGNANFAKWRANPKYVVKNESSNPITIIATIKQQDQRSRIVEGNEEDVAIKYLSCGMTLVQQNPPAAPPREALEEGSDTEAAPVDTATPPPIDHYINTPFITSSTCKFLHRGVYINQREVSNEIVLPPHSLCYLLPATIDAGTLGSFMLTVFVPDEAGETDVTVGPIEPYVRIDRPLECSFIMKANQRVKLSLNLDTTLMRAFDPVKGAAHYERAEIHVLLRQEKEVTKEGVIGDTVMEEYFALALHDPYNTRLPGSMTSALNYKETSLLFRATCTKGTYTVVAICAKALSPEEELPVTVTVLLPSECISEGAALTIQTNPPQKPLEEDDEEFPSTLPDEGKFGEFTAPTAGASPTREHAAIRSNSLRERPERRRSSHRSSITPGSSKSPAPPPPSTDKNPRNSPQPARSNDTSKKASSSTTAEPIAPKAPAGKKPATKGPSPKVSATKTAPPKKSAPASSSARPKVPPAKK